MTEDTVQQVRKVFDTVTQRYDNPAMRYFPFCAERLVHQLQPEPGSRVPDLEVCLARSSGTTRFDPAMSLSTTGTWPGSRSNDFYIWLASI